VHDVSASLHRHALGLTWTESKGMARSAHAVAAEGNVWLIDPFEDQAALAAAAELGRPAGVLQLLDRHNRDCEAIAERLGVPRQRVPEQAPGTPFEVVPMISRRGWREIALWWPAEQALIVAEALGTAPAFAVGRRAGVHPLLRPTPPRSQLRGYEPARLLVGHGEPLLDDAADAVRDALARARSDLPRLVLRLPGLLRGA
jgi:hypothetical protein